MFHGHGHSGIKAENACGQRHMAGTDGACQKGQRQV